MGTITTFYFKIWDFCLHRKVWNTSITQPEIYAGEYSREGQRGHFLENYECAVCTGKGCIEGKRGEKWQAEGGNGNFCWKIKLENWQKEGKLSQKCLFSNVYSIYNLREVRRNIFAPPQVLVLPPFTFMYTVRNVYMKINIIFLKLCSKSLVRYCLSCEKLKMVKLSFVVCLLVYHPMNVIHFSGTFPLEGNITSWYLY